MRAVAALWFGPLWFGSLWFWLGLALASAGQAGAPERSIRPRPRYGIVIVRPLSPAPKVALSPSLTNPPQIMRPVVHYYAKIRPKPREPIVSFLPPPEPAAPSPPSVNTPYPLATTEPIYRSPRPRPRPSPSPVREWRYGVRQTLSTPPARIKHPAAVFAITPPPVITPAVPRQSFASPGTVCGDPLIRGVRIPPIQGRLPGCHIENPVKITEIDGVRLSQPSILACQTARTLRGWVSNSVKPAFRFRGGGLAKLTVLSHYSCRTRNSRPGAKLSEHAKGRAIDIGAFTTRDGTTITVRKGWQNWRQKRLLKRLHDSACGPFGTVLGPDANRFHRDHFHFDIAHYRGGPYCR